MEISEAAYIAGLFDGEGCVTYKKRPTKRKDRGGKIYNQWHIRCEISMTDKQAITWLHETLGFGWSGEKKYNTVPKNYKKLWRWSCGYRDALKFAKIVWPYAIIKLNKLEKIIDHYEPRAQELGDNVVDLALEREVRKFNWNIHGS